MVNLSDIAKLWKTRQDTAGHDVLVASFKEMVAMRRYVPYLKGFKFGQTSMHSGDAKSSFKGRGMEFEEVRAYNYGDDVRDIDWRVTARKNTPYTKIYAEEKDREVFVWLDLSAQMRFGTKKELKSVTAAKTTALLGWFALENKDRFGVAVFDGQKTHIFKAERSVEHLLSVFKNIEKISEQNLYDKAETASRSKSLQILQKRLHKKSIIFAISSFEDFNDRLKNALTTLSKSNEMYLVNIFDRLEALAPPPGEYVAQYETDRQIIDSQSASYAQIYAAHFAQKRQFLKDFCAKVNCRYREVRNDLAVYQQLRPI